MKIITAITRICQGFAVLITLCFLWQLISFFQADSPVQAQPPTIAEAWLAPPASPLSVKLDRFTSPVTALAGGTSPSAPLATGPIAPQLILQGILQGNPAHAYILDQTTNQTLTVKEGDKIGVVLIKSIRERTVLIEREGETYELRI